MAPNDNELILQAQKGNAMAFEQLVFRYDKKVLSIASTYTNDPEEAKDIYQEVFIRVFRSLHKFQFRSDFFTWLYRIVVNTCLTYKSRRNKYRNVSLESEYEDGDQNMKIASEALTDYTPADQKTLDAEISTYIQRAMEQLSSQQKMVFTLKHFHGYKLKEIATIMNCAEGTIKKYLFEATERLRYQLKDVYE